MARTRIVPITALILRFGLQIANDDNAPGGFGDAGNHLDCECPCLCGCLDLRGGVPPFQEYANGSRREQGGRQAEQAVEWSKCTRRNHFWRIKLSLSRRQLDPCRQDFHSDARLAGNFPQEGTLTRIALDEGDAGRCFLPPCG